MGVLPILIIASLFVAICFLVAFLWAVKNGQYEDSYTPSIRMLLDDKKMNNQVEIEDKHGN